MNLFAGIRVVESPLCEFTVPVRKHKKRRWMTDRYHARIQKKWTKRFGMKKEHVAFMVNPRAAGLFGQPFIAIDSRYIVAIRNFT